jgi:hypothetical protein
LTPRASRNQQSDRAAADPAVKPGALPQRTACVRSERRTGLAMLSASATLGGFGENYA